MRHLTRFLPILTLALAPLPAIGAAYSDAQVRTVETEKESQIRELREQEMTQLRIAIGRRLPPNRMAELYFRLAELYVEGYRAEFLLEGRVHEGLVSQGARGPISRGRSRPYIQKGIQASNEILKLKIPYERMDAVYYFLAFNYGELEDRARSLGYYRQLTEKFPGSPYVLQAYKEMGDSAFKRSKYSEAQAFFEQALSRSKDEPRLLPEIYHRLAWCYYRTRQYPRAIDTMKKAIASTQGDQERFLNIREEALRDMAVFMTEQDRTDEAIEYFQKVAGDKKYYASVLERLGREYERSVKTDRAVEVYESLQKTNPEDEASFRTFVKLVELDLKRGAFGSAVTRLRKGRIITSGEPDTELAFKNLRALVRRTGTEAHERYRRRSDKKDLELAEAFYKVYLERILKESDQKGESHEIRMYLAEVERELGKPQEASALYQTVLEGGDKRYAREAGALWVGSLADSLEKAAKEKKGTSKSSHPSELELRFVEASDHLADNIPGSPEARKSMLRSAQILAGYSESRDDAVKRIERLLKDQPASPEAHTAAKLWIQMFADRLPDPKGQNAEAFEDRGSDLGDVLGSIEGNAPLMAYDRKAGRSEIRKTVDDQKLRLKVGRIASFEGKKDFGSAGKAYEEFASTGGKPELAEQSYENAVGAYTRGGQSDEAARVTLEWLTRHPRSARAAQGGRNAATALLIEGKYEDSARIFEKLAQTSGDGAAWLTAARIRAGLEQQDEARALWKGYLGRFGRDASAADVRLDLARSFERGGKATESRDAYAACARGPHAQAAECLAREGDLFFRVKDLEEARRKYEALGRLRPSGAQSALSPFVGYGLYRLAEMQERATAFDPLSFPESRLKASLQKRQAFFAQLTRSYLKAVDAGGPWGVAALHRLAAWTAGFADDVDRIEPPASMDAKAIAGFRKALSAVSGPLRREAVETWRKAYDRAVAGEVLSPVLPEVHDRLAGLRVNKIHRAQGFRGRLRLAGVAADGGSDGRDGALEQVRAELRKNARNASAWVDYGNLVWGEGKPGLSRLLYDRALELDPGNVAALNNRAVVLLSGEGQEDWFAAGEASALLSKALTRERLFIPAQMNRAALMGYYRVFPRAKALWEQVLTRTQTSDAHDGLAIALQGLGSAGEAAAAFRRADAMGASSGRFARKFHQAAASAEGGSVPNCLSAVGDVDGSPAGFEKDSMERLKAACEARING